MKKILLFVIVLAALTRVKAQELTLLTFESFTFADRIEFYGGDGKIQDGFQWGLGLEYAMSDEQAFELIYQNLKTDVILNDYLSIPVETVTGNATFNYILIGGTRYLPVNDVLSGFGTVDLGMTIASPDDPQYSSVTKFTWGARLGLRVKPEGRISMRIHAQILNPVQAFGGGLYFGTGGAGAGATTYSTIWQFNLGGSVNIRLK